MSGGPNLKAALSARVDQATAVRNYSTVHNLGLPQTCVSGGDLFFDIYGRVVPPTTLKTNGDAACGDLSFYNVQRRLAVENLTERNYIPIAQAGDRWGGDTQGSARNRQAQNLYEQGRGSHFVKQYKTPNNAPPDFATSCQQPKVQFLDQGYPRNFINMDAQISKIQI
jgi:hypothetical protein